MKNPEKNKYGFIYMDSTELESFIQTIKHDGMKGFTETSEKYVKAQQDILEKIIESAANGNMVEAMMLKETLRGISKTHEKLRNMQIVETDVTLAVAAVMAVALERSADEKLNKARFNFQNELAKLDDAIDASFANDVMATLSHLAKTLKLELHELSQEDFDKFSKFPETMRSELLKRYLHKS